MTFSQQLMYILVTVLLAGLVGYLSYYSGFEEGQKNPAISIPIEKAYKIQLQKINDVLKNDKYREGSEGWRISALYAADNAFYVSKRIVGFSGSKDRYGIWLLYGKNRVDSIFSANSVAKAFSEAPEKQYLQSSLLRSVSNDPSYLKIKSDMEKRLRPQQEEEGLTWNRIKKWFWSLFN